MHILGAHHIALKTANYVALREFYTTIIGLPVVGGFAGRNIIFLDLAGTTIELIEDTDTSALATRGWHHLAFEVADCDAAAAELRGHGIGFSMEPTSVPAAAPVTRIAFFADPDGNVLELYQPLGDRYPTP